MGEMLDRTGVAVTIGDWIMARGGQGEGRLLVVIMASAGLLGAVMSSTAIVAIFIPIVLRIAAETGLRASRLLIPVSYAALISGMLTLIATTPNLVVSEELKHAGYSEFGFFSFTPVGLAVLVVAIPYMVLFGRRLLPKETAQTQTVTGRRSLLAIWEDYRDGRSYHSVEVTANSALVGRTIEEAGLGVETPVQVLGLMRSSDGSAEKLLTPESSTVLGTGDRLLLLGEEQELLALASRENLSTYDPADGNFQRWMWELGGATVLVHPDSPMAGKRLDQEAFHDSHGVHVMGLRRNQQAVADFEMQRLAVGDSLMLLGRWDSIRRLAEQNHDFVVLETPLEQEQVVPAYRRRAVALAILAAMVLLSIFELVPLVAAVVMAVLAAGATGCLSAQDAYRSIHWSSVVLVAGMLPLADALEKTGGTEIVVNALMTNFGDAGPGLMLTVVFFLTAVLGLFLSNTASAVLVAPIAIYAAESLGVSPYPFAVAVLIAASAAFVTPVSTPVVTLVVEPGGYRFIDFVTVGVPLLFLTWLVTLLVAPLVFPF